MPFKSMMRALERRGCGQRASAYERRRITLSFVEQGAPKPHPQEPRGLPRTPANRSTVTPEEPKSGAPNPSGRSSRLDQIGLSR